MINDALLSQELKSNIIGEEDTKKIISQVLKVLSGAVSKSLGPYGSTTIIKDVYNVDHTITKDGYSILNKISFSGGMQSTILQLIRKISKSLVQEVGDGSTSAVVVAKELYEELNDFFKVNNVPRKDVLDLLEVLQEDIIERISEISHPLTTKEELIKVAATSNNNDRKIGDMVATIYEELGFDGFINLEMSTTDQTYHKITNGIEILRGYINFVYANQKDKLTCTFENPKVLMCNGELEESDILFIAELLTLSMASEYPLVIIAKSYSSDVINLLNNNKVRAKDKLSIVPIEYDLNTLSKHEEFQDLAVYLDGTIYDKFNGEQLKATDAGDFFLNKLGHCKKVVANEKRTLIIEGSFKEEEIADRLTYIDAAEELLNDKSNVVDVTDERYALDKRRSRLKGKIATLYVGGASSIEKRTRKDLVEDSIYAGKSAIEHGYIIGGNLIIPSILKKDMDEIGSKLMDNPELFKGFTNEYRSDFIFKIIDIVENSFSASFTEVLYNKFLDYPTSKATLAKCFKDELSIYNLKTGIYETIETTDVINSSMTDIEIMKSVFSIIGLLASSNQMLAVDNLYEY